MAIPERDTVYTNDGTNRTTYTRESSSTGWFVGIIVALALLAIGYLVFSANSGPSTPSTTVDVNNTPAVTAPADPAVTVPADPAITPAPMTEAPATGTETTPMTTAPADAAPAGDAAAPAVDAPAATEPAAPVTEPAPATP